MKKIRKLISDIINHSHRENINHPEYLEKNLKRIENRKSFYDSTYYNTPEKLVNEITERFPKLFGPIDLFEK